MPGIGGTDRKPGWADSRLCLGAKPPHARGQLEQWLAAGNNKGPTQQETRQPLLLNFSSSFDLAGKGFRSHLAVAEWDTRHNKKKRKLQRWSQKTNTRLSSLLGENVILQTIPRLARGDSSNSLTHCPSHLAGPFPPQTSWWRSRGLTPQLPKKGLPSKVCFTPAAPHGVAMEQPSNVCNTKLERTFDKRSFCFSPLSYYRWWNHH